MQRKREMRGLSSRITSTANHNCLGGRLTNRWDGLIDYTACGHPATLPPLAVGIGRYQAGELYSAGGTVDELSLANVQPDVCNPVPFDRKAQDIARMEASQLERHRSAEGRLLVADPWEDNAMLPVGVLDESGAVEAVRVVATPRIGRSHHVQSRYHDTRGYCRCAAGFEREPADVGFGWANRLRSPPPPPRPALAPA